MNLLFYFLCGGFHKLLILNSDLALASLWDSLLALFDRTSFNVLGVLINCYVGFTLIAGIDRRKVIVVLKVTIRLGLKYPNTLTYIIARVCGQHCKGFLLTIPEEMLETINGTSAGSQSSHRFVRRIVE